MKIELQEKLFNKFPLLYGDKDESIQVSLIPFGIECSEGWYQLIYDLSDKLEGLIHDWVKENGAKNYPRAFQVKEKFGGLRFYMTHATEEMYDLIEEAENKSYTICEQCGKPGEERGGSWILSLCDECDKKRNEQKKI
jgi:hypothetical protein